VIVDAQTSRTSVRSIRSPVVAEETMRWGNWLRSVLRVSFSAFV